MKYLGILASVLFFSVQSSAQVCIGSDVDGFLDAGAENITVSLNENLNLVWDSEREQYLGRYELNPRSVQGAQISCTVFSNVVGVIEAKRKYSITHIVDLTERYFVFPTNKYFIGLDNGAYLVCAANDLYAYAYGQMKIVDLEKAMGHGFRFHWQGRVSQREVDCPQNSGAKSLKGGCCRSK